MQCWAALGPILNNVMQLQRPVEPMGTEVLQQLTGSGLVNVRAAQGVVSTFGVGWVLQFKFQH